MSDLRTAPVVIDSTGPVPWSTLAPLAQRDHGPFVTVTAPTGPGARAALAGALDRAADLLAHTSLTPWEDHRLLEPLRERLDGPLPDAPAARGLVWISAPGLTATLAVPTEVPVGAHVGDVPHVLPLLPARRDGERYAVLCISEECVRYFEGDRDHLRPAHVPELPASLGGIVWQEAPEEATFTCPAVRAARGAGAPPVTAEPSDEHRERVRRFLRRVDYAVVAHLGTAEPLPLVVVGTSDLTERYAASSHYPWVVSIAQIDGWLCSSGVLHGHTWPAARAHLRAPLEQALEDIRMLRGTGLAAEHPGEVLDAAVEGGVAELVLAQRWCTGSADTADAAAVNAAVVRTWSHRGSVHVAADAELGGTGLLARLRY